MDEAVVYLRTTERRAYAECRQEWWWSFIDRLKAIETASALRFGDLVHQALGKGAPAHGLAPWYKPGLRRGTHPAKTFAILYDDQIEAGMSEFSIYGDEESVDARTLGISMLEEYVETYGKDEHMRIIAPEMAAQVTVLDRSGRPMRVPIDRSGRKGTLVYVMEFDAAYEDLNNGQVGLLETKTAAAIGTRHLGLDEQGGSYWTFAPVVLEKVLRKLGRDDLDFICYNFLRKAMPDQRPLNADGYRLNKPTKAALLSECDARGIATKRGDTMEVLWQKLSADGSDPALLGEPSKMQPPPNFVREKMYRDEANRTNLLQRIRMQAWEMGQVRAGKLPVYKNPRLTWPDQHCNACEFRDMCELHEAGSDWEELRDLTMTTWNPYEAHEPMED